VASGVTCAGTKDVRKEESGRSEPDADDST
jgi:hypothetical protein